MTPASCSFCETQNTPAGILFFTEHFFAFPDAYPVNKGHTLIIAKRHVADLFSLSPHEWAELPHVLTRAKVHLDGAYHPDGYNVGVNCGETAGQTIFHLHIHLIPRYRGDVDNPRGGIRNFKPALVEYK